MKMRKYYLMLAALLGASTTVNHVVLATGAAEVCKTPIQVALEKLPVGSTIYESGFSSLIPSFSELYSSLRTVAPFVSIATMVLGVSNILKGISGDEKQKGDKLQTGLIQCGLGLMILMLRLGAAEKLGYIISTPTLPQ